MRMKGREGTGLRKVNGDKQKQKEGISEWGNESIFKSIDTSNKQNKKYGDNKQKKGKGAFIQTMGVFKNGVMIHKGSSYS